jgi:hypothetical protein
MALLQQAEPFSFSFPGGSASFRLRMHIFWFTFG